MAQSIDVQLSGPIFDGRADAAAAALCADIERDIAAQGYSEVMALLNARIQHPTPYYETQVTVSRQGDASVVNDRGVVYGPWLEDGSGRQTRFRGYHAFGEGRERLEPQIPGIVQHAFVKHIREM